MIDSKNLFEISENHFVLFSLHERIKEQLRLKKFFLLLLQGKLYLNNTNVSYLTGALVYLKRD